MHLMYVDRCIFITLIWLTPWPYRTFMTLKNPSPLFRAMVLGAQGVFYNAFCEPSRISISIAPCSWPSAFQSCATSSRRAPAIALWVTSRKKQC